jgi:hypothetical protein
VRRWGASSRWDAWSGLGAPTRQTATEQDTEQQEGDTEHHNSY